MLTASYDHTARLWRHNPNGQWNVAAVLTHGGKLLDARFSPDGQWISTGVADRYPMLWRADNAKEGSMLPRPSGRFADVEAVLFTPDGKRVVFGSSESTDDIQVCAVDGTSCRRIPGAPLGINGALAMSADGEHIAGASRLGKVCIWTLDAPQQRVDLSGHTGDVWSVAFDPSGKRLVSAGSDMTARIWKTDARDSESVIVLKGHTAPVWKAEFSPDGTRVITVSDDHTARLWNADGTGEPIVLEGHRDRIRAVAFSPSGDRIATGSRDRTVRVWRVQADTEPVVAATAVSPHEAGTPRKVLSPTGEFSATIEEYDTGWLRNMRTGAAVELKKPISLFVFSPDGRRLLGADSEGGAWIWNLPDNRPAHQLPREQSKRECETIDQMHCRLGSPSGHLGAIRMASFNTDGRVVATVSADGSARVWSADRTTPIMVIAPAEPDGSLATQCYADPSAGDNGIATGGEGLCAQVSTFARLDHRGAITGTALDPSGERLVTVSKDGPIRLWNVHSGEPSSALPQSDVPAVQAEFTPDGAMIVSTSEDGTVRIWKADGQSAPILIATGISPIRSAKVNSDQTLAVTGKNGTVRRWSLAWPQLVRHLNSINSCLTAAQRQAYLSEPATDAVRRAQACEAKLRQTAGKRR